MANRVGGIIQLKVNGEYLNAKGSFTYGYGKEVRTTIVGADRLHGFSSAPGIPFIEGEITDDGEISMEMIAGIVDGTVTLELGNGKIFALYHAWSMNADGFSGETEESNIAIRFEGKSAKEIRA